MKKTTLFAVILFSCYSVSGMEGQGSPDEKSIVQTPLQSPTYLGIQAAVVSSPRVRIPSLSPKNKLGASSPKIKKGPRRRKNVRKRKNVKLLPWDFSDEKAIDAAINEVLYETEETNELPIEEPVYIQDARLIESVKRKGTTLHKKFNDWMASSNN